MDDSTTIKFTYNITVEPSAKEDYYVVTTFLDNYKDSYEIYLVHKDDVQWFLSFINNQFHSILGENNG